MTDHLRAALAKLRKAADDNTPLELTGIECRILLIELDVQRSTAAITSSPEFHDRVERYRRTGVL